MTQEATERVAALADALAPHAGDLSFMRAVQLLTRAFGGRLVGTTGPVVEEPVLFRSAPSMGFPAADIATLQAVHPPVPGEWPAAMEVNFLGLYGPASPLPPDWTERIATESEGAANLRDVLDLFGHPLVGLAYAVWRHWRVHLRFESGTGDAAFRGALALAGLVADPAEATPGARLEPTRLLMLSGLLAQHARSAEIVARLVGGYFELGAAVEEWVLRRAPVPAEQQFRLGAPQIGLGSETLLGDRVPDVAGAVCLVLGPLNAARFAAFLPGGAERSALSALMHLALREPLECRVDLLLAAGEPGGFVLGATRLGWDSWQAGGAGPRRAPVGYA